MSLKSHLADNSSPIRQFLLTEFPNTTRFLKDARRQVRLADTIIPEPASANIHIPWTTIGMALHYRIRYYFGVTSIDEMVAYQAALQLSPTREFAVYNSRRMSQEEISAKANGSVYLSPTTVKTYDRTGRRVTFARVLPGRRGFRDFFLQLESLLEELQPSGRKLDKAEEDKLNRYCYVLGLFEQQHRARTWTYSPLMDLESELVDEMLGIPDADWITDIRALSWRFYANLNHLLSLSRFLPTVGEDRGFGSGVGGAEPDLIVDDTLVEIKVSKKSLIKIEWFRQLLCYALLDYRDEFWIRGIGFYLARQGLLVHWSLEEVLKELCGIESPTIEDWFALRHRFQEVVEGL